MRLSGSSKVNVNNKSIYSIWLLIKWIGAKAFTLISFHPNSASAVFCLRQQQVAKWSMTMEKKAASPIQLCANSSLPNLQLKLLTRKLIQRLEEANSIRIGG